MKKIILLSSVIIVFVVAVIAISCSKQQENPGTNLASCGTCDWYGTNYPVCCSGVTISGGWGWQNNASCISASECTGAGQSCSGCSSSSSSSSSSSGGGGTILNGNGCDLQPSYYNDGNVNLGLSLMKTEGSIVSIRLEIDPSATGFSINTAKSWITQLKAAGYSNLICTYHRFGGSDNLSDLETAANWWVANYNTLGGGFIINLCNEWGDHNISASTYASYYNTCIAIVRKVYSGTIVIDIPGWGQETYTAYQACKTSSPTISDGNICLSTHIYPGNYNQGRGHTYQASDLADLVNTGRPCLVGEFGTGSGACNWEACVNQAKSDGWHVLGWAWNGDGGSLNMVSPSWASNPTATSFSTNSYFNTLYPYIQ